MKFMIAIVLALCSYVNAPCWGQSGQLNAPILPVRVADGTPVRHGFLSPYRRSVKRPLVSMGRVYIRGRFTEGRSRRNAGRVGRVRSFGGGLNGPGFIGRATFRPQGLF